MWHACSRSAAERDMGCGMLPHNVVVRGAFRTPVGEHAHRCGLSARSGRCLGHRLESTPTCVLVHRCCSTGDVNVVPLWIRRTAGLWLHSFLKSCPHQCRHPSQESFSLNGVKIQFFLSLANKKIAYVRVLTRSLGAKPCFFCVTSVLANSGLM